MIAAPELLDFATGDALIGDTAYDSNEFRAEVKAREIIPVIHSKPERRRALPLDPSVDRSNPASCGRVKSGQLLQDVFS
jgi:IS5 family transposase